MREQGSILEGLYRSRIEEKKLTGKVRYSAKNGSGYSVITLIVDYDKKEMEVYAASTEPLGKTDKKESKKGIYKLIEDLKGEGFKITKNNVSGIQESGTVDGDVPDGYSIDDSKTKEFRKGFNKFWDEREFNTSAAGYLMDFLTSGVSKGDLLAIKVHTGKTFYYQKNSRGSAPYTIYGITGKHNRTFQEMYDLLDQRALKDSDIAVYKASLQESVTLREVDDAEGEEYVCTLHAPGAEAVIVKAFDRRDALSKYNKLKGTKYKLTTREKAGKSHLIIALKSDFYGQRFNKWGRAVL